MMIPKPLLFLLIALLPLGALADIHKCLVNGKVTYSDQDCAGNKALPFQLTDLNTTAATTVSYKGSGWLKDNTGYSLASEASVKENAPVFIYSHTTWCGYCKKLDQTLLVDSDVIKTLAGFIKVDLNPEHSPADDKLFKSWGGTGYPTLYVQYPNQAPQRIPSPFTQQDGKWTMMPKEEFIAMLQTHLKPFEKAVDGKTAP